jgi:hypothetical protein
MPGCEGKSVRGDKIERSLAEFRSKLLPELSSPD